MLHRTSKPPITPANSLPPPDLVGRELGGRYRIEARLGAGGFGVVYRAWDKKEERAVAIKALREELASNSSLRKRFAREAKALATLRHPNIVTITDYGVIDELPILAMELLQGHALDQELKEQGPLSEERAVHVFLELLAGIEYMHERGLVHRDLKPGNIFVEKKDDGSECIKLLDFGLAKFLDGQGHSDVMTLTNTGEVFGTPGYMPPEQLVSEKADQRADIYSATVVMFQMLSGRRPFEGEPYDVLRSVLVDPPPTLQERCQQWQAHPALEAWFQRGMAKEPGARFRDVPAMRQALRDLPRPLRLPAGEGVPMPRQDSLGTADTVVPGAPTREPLATANISALTRLRAMLSRGLRRLLLASAALVSILSLVVIGVAAIAIYLLSSDNASSTTTFKDMLPKPTASAGMSPQAKQTAAKPDTKMLAVAEEATTKSKPAEPSDGTTATQAAAASSTQRPKARDPFRRATPKDLVSIRKQLLKGYKGNDRMIATLRAHNRDYPEDSRGHLLLAQLYNNRQWNKDVVTQYEFAIQRDPSSRGEPHMLANLVRLAGESAVSAEAAALIREAYGREAKLAVSQTLKRATEDAVRKRLQVLLGTLE